MSASVARFDDLVEGQPVRVEIGDHPVALVRIGGAVHAVDDRCSHADFSLAEGEVWAQDCRIECWKHGATFSLETGQPDSLPATQPIGVHDVSIVDGEVHVTIAERK